MTIGRVAVLFDNQSRPETTGTYCLRALGRLVEVEHFLPSQLDRVPRQGFDLYLHIDDSHEYRLPAELRPCAWWVIDTHLNFDWDCHKAADFDRVFAAQRDGAEQLRQAGITSASWLPLACDPDIHSNQAVDKQFDLAFVGNLMRGRARNCWRCSRSISPITSSASATLRTWHGPAPPPAWSSIAVSPTMSTCASSRPWPAARCY